MWYIFKSTGEVLGFCNSEPNIEDLASRGEICVEDERLLELSQIEFVEGQIIIKEVDNG